MLREKLKTMIKTTGILLLALFISNVVLSICYTGTNPSKLRPNLSTYLIAQLKKLSNPAQLIATLFPKENEQDKAYAEKKIKEGFAKLQQVAFTQIAPGVKVRAADNVSQTSYDLNGVKWIKQKVVVNGIERTFGWPEGQPLPPQEVLEGMFR